jgi:universal stress protein E
VTNVRRLLVIIDPTHDNQLALERAISKSELLPDKPEVCLFIGVDTHSPNLKAENKKLYRDEAWLKSITEKLDAGNIQNSFALCWAPQWNEAVIHVRRQFNADNILIPDYRDNEKIFELSNEKWALLRNSIVPVTIVRPGHSAPITKVLAAINMRKDRDPKYQKLNDKVLKEGAAVAAHYGAELHVVNSFRHISNHPGMEKVVARTNLTPERIHIDEGSPEDVIEAVAKEIEANIVVIGNLARDGALAFMKGNTSEKILRRIEQDVMVLS